MSSAVILLGPIRVKILYMCFALSTHLGYLSLLIQAMHLFIFYAFCDFVLAIFVLLFSLFAITVPPSVFGFCGLLVFFSYYYYYLFVYPNCSLVLLIFHVNR